MLIPNIFIQRFAPKPKVPAISTEASKIKEAMKKVKACLKKNFISNKEIKINKIKNMENLIRCFSAQGFILPPAAEKRAKKPIDAIIITINMKR